MNETIMRLIISMLRYLEDAIYYAVEHPQKEWTLETERGTLSISWKPYDIQR